MPPPRSAHPPWPTRCATSYGTPRGRSRWSIRCGLVQPANWTPVAGPFMRRLMGLARLLRLIPSPRRSLIFFAFLPLFSNLILVFLKCSRPPSALAALPGLCAAAVLSIGSASVFSSFGFQHNLRLTITCVTLDNNQMVVDMANESWGVGLSFAVSMTIRSLSSVMHVMVKVGLHCAEN